MTVASILAATLLADLGQEFTVPVVDLNDAAFALPDHSLDGVFDPLAPKTIEDLTTGVVLGTGAFDKIMASTKAHLQEQYEKGVISGADYTRAYIELTNSALTSAMEFLFRNQESHWASMIAQFQAQRAEIDAVTAKVQLETAKHQLSASAQQALLLEAQHVLAQMQIANEDAKYNLAEQQMALVGEQIEAQRAQTLDTRTDGVTAVNGMIGQQKALYSEQILSYQKDAQSKVARMLLDTWITQKSIDEGLTAPSQLVNAELDEVIVKLRASHSLD